MFSEGALKIELHRGAQVSVLEIQYERALVGSGAHCDVRLGPDEASTEQLVIELVGEDEVFARTLSVRPACLLNGAPFLEGRLLPTSMLELGSVALCVQRIARQDGSTQDKGKQRRTSPLVQAAGLVGVAAGLWFVLAQPGQSRSALTRSVEAPKPEPIAAETCPRSEPLAAAALAEQLQTEAESKRERAPFYAGDAVAAVPLFERAASCHAKAGHAERAKEAHAAALSLHVQVSEQLHLRHVRLERFLAQKQYQDVRRQAGVLAELVPNKHGDYATWLSAVRREAELRHDAGKK